MDLRSTGGKLETRQDDELVDANGNPIPGDFDVANGEEHDREMIERIVYEPKGSFVLNPTIGVNAQALLNGPFRPGSVEKRVKINLKADNFTVFGIDVSGEGNNRTLTINARRR